jgi:NAD(P)H-hydrate repair Nnr-like enzyme with NAD(P)H-hydrate dehydratase domain
VLAAPSGALLFPHAGHPALAIGGSGDALAGMLAALLARWHAQARDGDQHAALPALREITAAEIICTAVNWHSAAARRWSARHGDNGMTAVDLIEELPDALEELRRFGGATTPA